MKILFFPHFSQLQGWLGGFRLNLENSRFFLTLPLIYNKHLWKSQKNYNLLQKLSQFPIILIPSNLECMLFIVVMSQSLPRVKVQTNKTFCYTENDLTLQFFNYTVLPSIYESFHYGILPLCSLKIMLQMLLKFFICFLGLGSEKRHWDIGIIKT